MCICVPMSMHACTQCSMMISTHIFLVRVLVTLTKIPWTKVTWRRKGLFPLTACPSLMEVIAGTWNQELIQRIWRRTGLFSTACSTCFVIPFRTTSTMVVDSQWAGLPYINQEIAPWADEVCSFSQLRIFLLKWLVYDVKLISTIDPPHSELNTQTHYSSTVTFPQDLILILENKTLKATCFLKISNIQKVNSL